MWPPFMRASAPLVMAKFSNEFVASGGLLGGDPALERRRLALATLSQYAMAEFLGARRPSGLRKSVQELRTTFSIEEMQWAWPLSLISNEAKAYIGAWRSERDDVRCPIRLLKKVSIWQCVIMQCKMPNCGVLAQPIRSY